MWLIYGAEFLGVIVFRFRKDTKDIKRPYKVPLVIAFFCLGVSLFMTLTPIISDSAIGYLVVCGTIALGLVVYIPLKLGWSIKPLVKVLDWIEARLQILLGIVPDEKSE